MKSDTVPTVVPIIHEIPLINDKFSATLITSLTSVSHLDILQPERTQPKNLEFQYGWCEGGLRVQELSATANIYGSLGFLWLLTIRPHQWRTVYIGNPMPSFFYNQIEVAWGSKLFFSSRNDQASIDFLACHPGETLSLGNLPTRMSLSY